jgi:hypothetical protein
MRRKSVSSRRKSISSRREVRASDRAVMNAIGRILAAQFDLAEPLSDRLGYLLKRIKNRDAAAAVETQRARMP